MIATRNFGIVVIATAVVAVAIGFLASQPPPRPSQKPAPAPDDNIYQAADLPQFEALRKSLVGQVVVVNFWATWCGPCQMEIPALQKLYEKHRDQGLAVIGVGEDVFSEDVLKEFEQQLGTDMTYRVLHDPTRAISRSFMVFSLPKTVVFDRAGNRRQVFDGYGLGLQEDLEALVLKLLKEK